MAKTRELSSSLKKTGEFSSRTSAFTDQYRTEITYLSVSQLVPYHKQARTIFVQEDIDTLAATIKEHGVRQPLTVLRVESDVIQFEVVSGERRLRAAKQLGLLTLPCIIITDKDKAEEIALIENVQRKDLHPLELAISLKRLIDKIGYGGQSELTKKVGLSQPQISELIKITALPQKVQDEILSLNYRGRDNFRKLYLLNNENEQINYIRTVMGVSAMNSENNTKKEKKTKSLLRLTLMDDGIHVQRAKLWKLPPEARDELKQILLDLIDEIEDI